MTISGRKGGSGKTFLSASMITEGITATINDVPYEETVDDVNKLRIPLKLDEPVYSDFKESDVTEVLFTPGSIARSYLAHTFNTEDENALVNRKVRFTQMSLAEAIDVMGQDSSRLKFPKKRAWFVERVDGSSRQVEADEALSEDSEEVQEEAEAPPQPKPKKAQAQGTQTWYDCPHCAYRTREGSILEKHIKANHLDRVSKPSSKKGN